MLAPSGYRAHLVDLTPLHVEHASALAKELDNPFTVELGDARRLLAGDRSFDAALLLGPLYHLVERSDRLSALREAKRVVRPDGLVAVAAISRLASSLDGIRQGYVLEPGFLTIMERDLAEGQHRNPDLHPGWFTTAYFHRPSDLRAELEEAGLRSISVFGVEGPGWLRDGLWDDPANREAILTAARLLEDDPDGVAVSAHLLAVGTV